VFRFRELDAAGEERAGALASGRAAQGASPNADMKTVNGIATAGGAKAAWFKDTEGNILALVQSLSARSR